MYTLGADLREGRTGSHILPPLEMTCGSLHGYTKSVVTLQFRHSLVVHTLLSKILDPPVRVQAEKMSSILAIPFHDNVAEGLPQNLQRRRDFQSINS